jgi:hypothetical protein
MPPQATTLRPSPEPSSARTSATQNGLAGVALLLALASCRQTTALPDKPEPAAPTPAAPTSAAPSSEALPGRIVAIAAMASGDRNQVVAIDPASGATEPLWTTPEGGNASDWSPAPDGRQVAYRLIQRSSPLEAVEAIVVRELAPEAAPIIVAGLDTSTARLAGFVWAPDGRRIAYLKRRGALLGAGAPTSSEETLGAPAPGDAWELHVVEWAEREAGTGPVVPDDRVIWQSPITEPASDEVALVGWDPAGERAALAEVAGDSGITKTVLLIDPVSGEDVERHDINLPPASIAPSPDGRRLALPELEANLPLLPSPPRLRLLELATGEITDLTTPAGFAAPGDVVWAPDASWLAWQEYPADGSASSVRVAPAAGDRPGFVVRLDGASAQPLAFAPDASALLVGVAAPAGGPPERLAIVQVPGGERTDLPWTAPADAWGMSWLR